jgi:23S rRNA U2552 (ribose-2'-O)-methylase RlmE/FtsJ
MKKLTEFPEHTMFYKGTIIVIKNAHITPEGNFDKRYCMVLFGQKFEMLDLYKSTGSIILHDLAPNVRGHVAVDKLAVKEWCRLHYEYFYTHEMQDKWIPQLDDLIYIEDLHDYFPQANRDLPQD